MSGYKAPTPTAAALFKFVAGSSNVYVYVPFTTTLLSTTNNTNADVIDLTNTYSYVPSNSLASFTSTQALSAFNLLINTDYNQWYTAVSDNNTILISKFVYNINNTSTASATTLGAEVNAIDFNSKIGSTGDKLCYASLVTGNVSSSIYSFKPI